MSSSRPASSTVAPPRLRPGDTVGICSPASPVSAERLRRGVEVLSERYRVQVSEGALASQGYLAGNDDHRAGELNQLLRDPDVRAIIPAQGGYGITRILDRLDAAALRDDPKIIVGFSDATALLCWAYRAAGIRSVHGPMVASLAERSPSQQQHMLDLLEGKELPSPIPCDTIGAFEASTRGLLDGPLLGGNLTLLSALIGTSSQIRFDGALLFFEEIDKLPSTVDRLLTHLHSAGALAGAKAALLGDLPGCAAISEPAALEVVCERMASFGIPLLAGVPVGHGTDNLALPFGARASVDLDRGELSLLEGAVA